ncbi:MAG: extracellular solute-binding protein [Armatimonadota bacterium]|nr:extracellular solute-binding protein [Armatimonadota bacterium]MDR7532496.1 extracellular solute-binding protein [Armatimonadota bacterium]MDR7535613.1 extracellular solute-binding protein [Armatimonadota bacterium]
MRLATAAAVVLAGGGPAQAQASVLNLYNARHYDTDQALYDEFTRQTGVRVNLIQGDADQLIERIKAEGAGSPADVLITVDAGRLYRAQQAGLCQRIASPVLSARLPASLRDPEGAWYGFTKRMRVIAYARERVARAELSTYEDLADPRWRGRVLVRSSSHVYNQSLVGALVAWHGEPFVARWARGIVQNFARPPQGGDTDQLLALAAGEGDVALVNHYYYVRLLNSPRPHERAAAAKVGLFFPNQGLEERGVHVNLSGACVVATAAHRAAAVAFLEYLASDGAQEIFARGNFEFPAVRGITNPLAAIAPALLREDPLNARIYAANGGRALQLMVGAGWR